MATDKDFGAFMEKFTVPPNPSPASPLKGLTFAVKDIFDVEGHVTGFGNPDWLRTHRAATSTAPAISALLAAGATSVGITVMDEMAFGITGENAHYGTPRNPHASDRVPGGSSSGSAVAVAVELVDFSIGTDTGGSVRIPASYCGIFGIRPSHGAVTAAGVIPMAQSFDTVGWFARDSAILKRVGCVLLQQPLLKQTAPSQIIIADDCFMLCSVPRDRLTQSLVQSAEKLFGGDIMKNINIGDYIEENVPCLKHFMTREIITRQEYHVPSLTALSSSMRMLRRCTRKDGDGRFFWNIHMTLLILVKKFRYEFKNNHSEWIASFKPVLGPGVSERIMEEMATTDDEKIDVCRSVKTEFRSALSNLLGDDQVLAIPTVPGPPPKLQTDIAALQTFRARAFSLLCIAGGSGFCQVSIPLGLHEDLPVSLSLIAKHGSDEFLLSLVEKLWEDMQSKV